MPLPGVPGQQFRLHLAQALLATILARSEPVEVHHLGEQRGKGILKATQEYQDSE